MIIILLGDKLLDCRPTQNSERVLSKSALIKQQPESRRTVSLGVYSKTTREPI